MFSKNSNISVLGTRAWSNEETICLPNHLVVYNSPNVFWTGLCTLISVMDASCIRSRLLSDSSSYKDFINVVLSGLDEDGSNHTEIFIPSLHMFGMLLNNLETKFWQLTFNNNPRNVIKQLFSHPTFLKSLQTLVSLDENLRPAMHNNERSIPRSLVSSLTECNSEGSLLSWMIPFVRSVTDLGTFEDVIVFVMRTLCVIFTTSTMNEPIFKKGSIAGYIPPLKIHISEAQLESLLSQRSLLNESLQILSSMMEYLFVQGSYSVLLNGLANWLPIVTAIARIMISKNRTSSVCPPSVNTMIKTINVFFDNHVGKSSVCYNIIASYFNSRYCNSSPPSLNDKYERTPPTLLRVEVLQEEIVRVLNESQNGQEDTGVISSTSDNCCGEQAGILTPPLEEELISSQSNNEECLEEEEEERRGKMSGHSMSENSLNTSALDINMGINGKDKQQVVNCQSTSLLTPSSTGVVCKEEDSFIITAPLEKATVKHIAVNKGNDVTSNDGEKECQVIIIDSNDSEEDNDLQIIRIEHLSPFNSSSNTTSSDSLPTLKELMSGKVIEDDVFEDTIVKLKKGKGCLRKRRKKRSTCNSDSSSSCSSAPNTPGLNSSDDEEQRRRKREGMKREKESQKSVKKGIRQNEEKEKIRDVKEEKENKTGENKDRKEEKEMLLRAKENNEERLEKRKRLEKQVSQARKKRRTQLQPRKLLIDSTTQHNNNSSDTMIGYSGSISPDKDQLKEHLPKSSPELSEEEKDPPPPQSTNKTPVSEDKESTDEMDCCISLDHDSQDDSQMELPAEGNAIDWAAKCYDQQLPLAAASDINTDVNVSSNTCHNSHTNTGDFNTNCGPDETVYDIYPNTDLIADPNTDFNTDFDINSQVTPTRSKERNSLKLKRIPNSSVRYSESKPISFSSQQHNISVKYEELLSPVVTASLSSSHPTKPLSTSALPPSSLSAQNTFSSSQANLSPSVQTTSSTSTALMLSVYDTQYYLPTCADKKYHRLISPVAKRVSPCEVSIKRVDNLSIVPLDKSHLTLYDKHQQECESFLNAQGIRKPLIVSIPLSLLPKTTDNIEDDNNKDDSSVMEEEMELFSNSQVGLCGESFIVERGGDAISVDTNCKTATVIPATTTTICNTAFTSTSTSFGISSISMGTTSISLATTTCSNSLPQSPLISPSFSLSFPPLSLPLSPPLPSSTPTASLPLPPLPPPSSLPPSSLPLSLPLSLPPPASLPLSLPLLSSPLLPLPSSSPFFTSPQSLLPPLCSSTNTQQQQLTKEINPSRNSGVINRAPCSYSRLSTLTSSSSLSNKTSTTNHQHRTTSTCSSDSNRSFSRQFSIDNEDSNSPILTSPEYSGTNPVNRERKTTNNYSTNYNTSFNYSTNNNKPMYSSVAVVPSQKRKSHDLWFDFLNWSPCWFYSQTELDSHGPSIEEPHRVPNRFKSYDQYFTAMKPLILFELWNSVSDVHVYLQCIFFTFKSICRILLSMSVHYIYNCTCGCVGSIFILLSVHFICVYSTCS